MKKVLTVVIVLLVVLLGGAFLLSSDIQVQREVVIQATPAQIHPFIADLEAWEAWSPFDANDDTIVYTWEGPHAGVGASRSWTSEDSGDGRMTITKSDPQTGVTLDMLFDGEMPATITFTFEPQDGGGTLVVWRDDFDVGNNPVYRWMGLAMDSMVGGYFEQGLASLKHEVESANPG